MATKSPFITDMRQQMRMKGYNIRTERPIFAVRLNKALYISINRVSCFWTPIE